MQRLARETGVLVLFSALTAAMTWPLLPNFTTALAHPEDPALVAWILDWDFHALLNDPLRLFEANIFHPHRHTLAFTENLLGIALPLLPLHLAGASPIVVLNVGMFLAFVLSGYGAYVLARVVTASTGAAICSGIWFAFFSFRFTHLTHLQHLWALWLPLTLAALISFARRPGARTATLLGLCFLMNGLTNLHWLAFGGVAIALSVLVFAQRDRRYWIGATAAIVMSSAALVPILLPYQRVRELYGLRGDPAETLRYSATVRDWGVSSLHSRWYGPLLGEPAVNPELWLFPGALVLLLASIGLFRAERRIGVVALVWVALGFFGSLGLNGIVGRFLFDHVALFKGIRVPARWSFIAYTGLALLAACGVEALSRSFRPRGRAVLQTAIACALVVELFPVPLRWFLALPDDPPLYAWVAEERDRGAIIELPLAQKAQYEIMLRSSTHHRPMINGVAGSTPRAYTELALLSESSPVSPDLLPRLEASGVTTVVVHGDRLGPASETTRAWLQTLLRDKRLSFARSFDAELHGDHVFLTRRHPHFGESSPPPLERFKLERFLAGEPVQNESTFGWLESPALDQHVRGRLRISGWALSPWGIRAVNIRLANGRLVIPAELVPRADVVELHPWYPMTERPGFVMELDPMGLPPATDIQIEIIDGRGRRKRLRDVWFTWTR